MAEPERVDRPGSTGLRSHWARALRRAVVLFLVLAAAVVAVAVVTDGVPHLPFDYDGFD